MSTYRLALGWLLSFSTICVFCAPACTSDDDGAEGAAGAPTACVESGGKLETTLCCPTTHDFPNLCLIGACGCSPDNSVPTETCQCPAGHCFDGKTCVVKR